MRTGVIAMIALCLSVIVATAQTDQTKMTWAIGEVAQEIHVCGTYFRVISECIKPRRPDIAVTYQQMADRIVALAIPGQLAAGLSDKAILAENTAFARAMMKAMDGNCSNIQVVLSRYLDFCQRLDKDSDGRIKEWTACLRNGRQTCDGPGLP